MWNKTMELFQMVNQYIPLDALWIAGLAVAGVVLVLSVLGCILRRQLVPHWLIWLYFTFAVIVIWSQDAVNVDNVLTYLEYPIVVVLVCYLVRALFTRRPRYCYVKTDVYERRADRGKKNKAVKEVKEVKEEIVVDAKADKEIETVTVKETNEAKEEVVEENVTIMPEVEPIPQKTYEPVREPEVVNTTVMNNLPNTSAMSRTTTTTTTVRPTVTPRPVTSTTTATTNGIRPLGATATTTTARTTTTTASTTRPSTSFANTYTPRPTTTSTSMTSRPTVTTTTTTTTARPTTAYSSTTTTTSSTTSSSSTTGTKSTQDIMDAIARLRASMNKK